MHTIGIFWEKAQIQVYYLMLWILVHYNFKKLHAINAGAR